MTLKIKAIELCSIGTPHTNRNYKRFGDHLVHEPLQRYKVGREDRGLDSPKINGTFRLTHARDSHL